MKLASPQLVFAAVQNRLLAPAPVPPGLRDGTWTVKTRHFRTVRCAAPAQNADPHPEFIVLRRCEAPSDTKVMCFYGASALPPRGLEEGLGQSKHVTFAP